ncbi:MAG TPA: AraC family transcriptional regulator, partial [Haloferula sp.]
VFHGDAKDKPSARLLGGYFAFDPLNAPMLLGWLPRIVHIRASDPAIGGVMPVIGLIQREALEKRSGHSFVLTRLAEVILIEALRATPVDADESGLLAGLRDMKLAGALRAIHTQTAKPWSLETLAREAGMSRSSFAERFARVTGSTPLDYLLQWRLAVAKDLLAHGEMNIGETALAVGYESASGFSTAFSRETGESPKQFVERQRSTREQRRK